MNFSMNMAPFPKAAFASELARSNNSCTSYKIQDKNTVRRKSFLQATYSVVLARYTQGCFPSRKITEHKNDRSATTNTERFIIMT
jgi:hypothetical protein